MTRREITRSRLAHDLPTLLGDASVAVVVAPDVEDGDTTVVWEIARATARSGRRVALADLCLERPKLVPPVPPQAPEGIVDAFLFGASWSRVATEQDTPGLFFIPAGTAPADPAEVWGHARWRRLARGFAEEGALLLLFAPPVALAQLAVEPGLIVTVATERERAPAVTPADTAAVIAVVPDPTPAAPPTPPARRERPSLAARLSRPAMLLGRVLRERERRGRAVAVAAVAAVFIGLGVVGIVLAVGGPGSTASPLRAGALGEAGAAAPTSAAPPPAASPAASLGDSLFYSVQVAAFQSATQALDQAAQYEARGWTAMVAPVRLGRQGVWHRLLVGALPTPEAAEERLRAVWASGLLERPNGSILRTPHAFALGMFADAATAAAEVATLREHAIAGYIVETSDGARLLLAGAFESPEQAALADSILTAAGRNGTLVTRVGIAR